MNLHYFGHSAFQLKTGSSNVLIDPFLRDNPLCDTDPSAIDGITHILVTHGHGDHIGDTIEIAKKCDALVVCNFELSAWFEKSGVRTHAMHIGGSYSFDFGKVKMTTATHGSGIKTEKGMIYGGNPCGFLIDAEGKKIYHAGDTGLTMDMKLLEMENVDYALLPVGGNFTMDVRDAATAADFIKPKNVIPMHYNTFPAIEASPEEMNAHIKDSMLIQMKPNTTIEL